MEQHRKKYIRPGDLLFADRINSDGFAPPDDRVKDVDTLDATHDNTTASGTSQEIDQVSPVRDPRLLHPFYAGLMRSQGTNEETTFPRVSKRNIILPDMLKDTTKGVSTPTRPLNSAHIFDTSTTSLNALLQDPHSLCAMLESTYCTTSSDEIRDVIACLVNLDVALTRQSRLNEFHEAHTAKNFREQRHLNKDRKLRIGTIMKSVDHRFAGMDAKRMVQETSIKQCEVRTNSYAIQLRGLNDKVKKLAEGGEWAKTEVDDIKHIITDLQGEVEGLKLANLSLRDEVRGLEDEVRGLKEKEEIWERRLAALEKLSEKGKETHLSDFCVKKEQVLNAASFAVGNGRVFSIAR